MWKATSPTLLLLALLSSVHSPPAAAQQELAPRLDRISLWGTRFGDDGTLTTWLYVQGANLHPAAEVLVDGEVQASIPHQTLDNDLLGVNPATLGYPIHHYQALVVAPGRRPAGSTLRVQLRNPGAQTSETKTFRLPVAADSLDSDGDDIPDAWELRGYDAEGDGTVEVDLPALGANPYRPDVLLEVDRMEGLRDPPADEVFEVVRAAFRSAPILNPQGGNGIHLYVDATGTVPSSPLVSLYQKDNLDAGVRYFYDLKRAGFDERARGRLFHYCIWAVGLVEGGGSGISDVHVDTVSQDIDGPGDDCMVALEHLNKPYNTARNVAATLMHELGHNLQQRHGGRTLWAYTPNYNSVMSYSWQLRTAIGIFWRAQRPVCAPLAYGRVGALEVDGYLPPGVGNYIDFSEGMGRDLVEAQLNELEGVCNQTPVNFNGNETWDPVSAADLNADKDTDDRLSDFPDWFELVFSGPRLNGMFHFPPEPGSVPAAGSTPAAVPPPAPQAAPADDGSPVAALDEILALAPDEAMRARWRALAGSGQLPPLNTLTLRAQPRTRRVRALAQLPPPRPMAAPPPQVGGLSLVMGQGIARYNGQMSLDRVELGRISGTLEERDAPVEIRFELPSAQQRLDLSVRDTLSSTLRSEVIGVSHRSEVALADDEGTLLLYVSEGSAEPYRREFKGLPLRVQQLPPDAGGESALRISFGDEQFTLAPGQRRRVTHQGERYEIFVGATSYTPAALRLQVEGEPFRVRLMVWRRNTPAQ